MKRETIEKVQDILSISMNSLLLFAAWLTIVDIFMANALHLLWVMVVIAAWFICYFVGVKEKTKAFPVAAAVLGFGIFSMAERFQTRYDWQNLYLIFTFVYLTAYFIRLFLKQYLEFLALNEKSAANVSEKEIFQGGLRRTLLYCAGSFLFLLFAANLDWFSKIMRRIGDACLRFLQELFADMDLPVPEEQAPGVMEDMLPEIEDKVESELNLDFHPEFIRRFLIGLFSLIAIISFLAVLYLIIKYGRQQFAMRKKKKLETMLDETADVREKCQAVKIEKKRENWFAFLSYRERIRKLYRKRMLAEKKTLVGDRSAEAISYMTAQECCESLGKEPLAEIYEKVRYSSLDITAGDVTAWKRAE